MDLIQEYTRAITVNSRDYSVIVRIFTEPDHEDLVIGESFDFADLDANKAYLERFEAGELLNTLVSVKVSLEGFSCVSGGDYLGACHVRAENLKEDVLDLVTDHGMVDQACDELSREIESLRSILGYTG